MLTACLGSECRVQDVQWFETKMECEVTKGLYEQIPLDGDWTSVEYVCKPVGSEPA